MKISAIVAQASNRVIGANGDIPWRGKLKGEQALFLEHTLGKVVVMGRKTWESIPPKFRPLRNRLNIVVTGNPSDTTRYHLEANSLKQALFYAECSPRCEEVVLIGGQRVYEEGLPLCTRLYLTTLEDEYEGDTFFPELNKNEWTLEYEKCYPLSEGRRSAFTFQILERKS